MEPQSFFKDIVVFQVIFFLILILVLVLTTRLFGVLFVLQFIGAPLVVFNHSSSGCRLG
ncbi:hypothetical protein BJV78DRAFT_1256830 [Lactifluus subvellereus]|nr:hypothetical protein BJV78DRAFT_1256830 [Lactifluus subvellereus]